MFLTWRPMEGKDFEACRRLLPDQYVYDEESYACIPEFWESLMQTGHFETGVVEDQERPVETQIVGFVTLVFPSNDFVAELQRPKFPPYVNCQVVRRWMQGASPLLTTAQVRKANGGDGVNLLFLQFGFLPDHELTGDPRFVRDKMYQVCSEIGLGYNVRQFLVEVYTREMIQYNLNAGFRLLSCGPIEEGPADDAGFSPCVMAATREQPLEGTTLGPYFIHRPPLLHFKEAEQQLLCRALLGESDEESAHALGVSVSTVHKRWMAIYARVGHHLPVLLPAVAGTRDAETGRHRGLEKRRHLLLYLQSHREELRPYPIPVATRKRSEMDKAA